MKNIVLIILALLIVTTGIVYASQKKNINKENKIMDKKVLVAYFSRTGEQYSVGNITEGNTAIVAKIIAEKTNGDLFEIKVAQDNYPKDYTALTEYAQKEKTENARPKIVGKVDKFVDYDTIFIGYPIWWGDKPMPVYTFLESYDFNGKTIVPFATHEGSGFCGTDGMTKTGAKVLKGIGIYGHVAQNDRAKADKQVTEWLKGLGF